jgi:hypothetical protein
VKPVEQLTNREIALEAERLADQLQRAHGIPREKALASAYQHLGTVPPSRTPAELEADETREERAHVREADKQLRALGFRVINTSQPRHAKFITPGVPDRFYFHRARRIGFAWEAKSATGRQSAAQRDFQEDMDACGWSYVLGTDQDLFAWLVERGIAVRDECGNLVTPAAEVLR